MKADGVFVTEYMKLGILPFEVQEPKYDEVLVKTMACGVCCWDSWLYRGVNAPGEMPYIIGHEGVGIIEKIGEGVSDFKVGDKVFCASGSNEMMCEYVTLKSDCIVKLPDDTEDWAKAVIEPNCCVVNLLNKAQIEAGDHVVLVGAGYMGQLTLMGLTNGSQAGRITVFELREDRRKMALEYGPTEVYDPESDEGKKAIADIIAKGGADIVIDFGASDSGFHLADSMTKQAGKLVIGSFHRGKVTFDGTKWHLGGLTVLNLSPMSNAHYNEILPRTYELIKRGIYDPGKFITHTAYYRDAKAMEAMFQRAVDKGDNYIKGAVLFTK
ncbi:MAG: alcohol dehydrogenase catalytic domain-containing protein [Oscillospiraceae bacterium]